MTELVEVILPNLPDMGNIKDIKVVELLVSAGDWVDKGDSLITVESEQFTLEIPSSYSGVIEDMKIAVGDKLFPSDILLTMNPNASPSTDNYTQTPDEIYRKLYPYDEELNAVLSEKEHHLPDFRKMELLQSREHQNKVGVLLEAGAIREPDLVLHSHEMNDYETARMVAKRNNLKWWSLWYMVAPKWIRATFWVVLVFAPLVLMGVYEQ